MKQQNHNYILVSRKNDCRINELNYIRMYVCKIL